MNAPIEFDVDNARQCLSVVIGLCELAAESGDGPHTALDSELFDAAACLLMKSRDVLDGINAPAETAIVAVPVAKPKRGKAAA